MTQSLIEESIEVLIFESINLLVCEDCERAPGFIEKGTGKKVRKTSINFIASLTSTHFIATRYPFIPCSYLHMCTIICFASGVVEG